VTPAGIGREAFWKGIQESVSRVRPLTSIDAEWGEFVAAFIEDDELRPYMTRFREYKQAARHTIMGAAGAVLAIEDAKVDAAMLRRGAGAVVCGTAMMDFGGITLGMDAMISRGMRGVRPRLITVANVAHVAETIAAEFDLKSRNMTVQSSCCSGLDAVGQAAQLIESGEVDFAICGGTESPLYRHPLLEFRAAGMTPASAQLAERQCRPFDLWRTTGVISEGACMFLLEPEESPRPGYAWVSGYAFAGDPPGELCGGLATSISHALINARMRPSEVEAFSACAPGHREVDPAEAAVMSQVFGHRVKDIATYSIKGALGHALAAAPAIQVAAAALGLVEGVIPPTVNFRDRDPTCGVNVSSRLQVIPHQNCVVSAHGSCGTNASLVLKRCG
jgi:3-oxoacyl-(acyl-carrier-protein) synthase